MTTSPYPSVLADEKALDDWMTRPSEALISFVATLKGPVIVLGAGGKMGPSLCVLLKRAAEATEVPLRVLAVSRFSKPQTRLWLDERGVETVACDLMDRAAVAALPDAEHVLYLVGLKFGTQSDPSTTWAINALVPPAVVERYAGKRIVALSSGNVYPMVPITSKGSLETDPLTPLGEYPNACVARERIFQYCSQQTDTPGVLVRLNYAVDLRYGVLVDLAQKIATGQPVDVTMGYLNCIWQRDANDMIIRALGLADIPMQPLNLTGTETLSVRTLAERLATHMGRSVTLVGQEAPSALLNDASRAAAALGPPETPLDTVLQWTADWVVSNKPTLNKPTRFEVRDGQY